MAKRPQPNTPDYDPSQIVTKAEAASIKPGQGQGTDYDPSVIAIKSDITHAPQAQIGGGGETSMSLFRDQKTVAEIAHWLNLEIALENSQGNVERATTIANIRSVMIDHPLMAKENVIGDGGFAKMKKFIAGLLFMVWSWPASAFTIPAAPAWLPSSPPCFGATYSFFIKAAYHDIVEQRELTPLEATAALVSSCIPFGNYPVNFVIRDNPCTLAVSREAFKVHGTKRSQEEKWFRIAQSNEGWAALPDNDYFNAAYAKAYKSCKVNK